MKHKINCRFCGSETGELEIKDELVNEEQEITNEALGILDVRCSACEKAHGSYKEMEEEFILELGENKEEFKAVMEEAGFKKNNFKKILENKKTARKKEIEKEIALAKQEKTKK